MTESASIVIFGATGDLTRRKLVPALYNLFRKGRIDGETQIVGFARRDWSDEKLRDAMEEGVKEFAPESLRHFRLARVCSSSLVRARRPGELG